MSADGPHPDGGSSFTRSWGDVWPAVFVTYLYMNVIADLYAVFQQVKACFLLGIRGGELSLVRVFVPDYEYILCLIFVIF